MVLSYCYIATFNNQHHKNRATLVVLLSNFLTIELQSFMAVYCSTIVFFFFFYSMVLCKILFFPFFFSFSLFFAFSQFYLFSLYILCFSLSPQPASLSQFSHSLLSFLYFFVSSRIDGWVVAVVVGLWVGC